MSRSVVVGLDRRALRRALDGKRREMGLSWRGVASLLAVSPSTLSRLGPFAPSADALMCMLAWLGHPVEPFANRVTVPR